MKVIILGCGRVGSTLARSLDSSNHEVTVIDWNEQQFQRLGSNFGGETVIGTGIDEDVLRLAGIEYADVFVAVTNGDNRNIMASQIARTVFDVSHVLTRIYDPVRATMYHQLGLDTVCSTTTMADIMQSKITSEAAIQETAVV